MTLIVKSRIIAQCNAALARASLLFPNENFTNVEIRFDLRGAQAAQARRDWDEYSMRFNLDYAMAHLDHLLADTVPHEVAHIARFKTHNDNTHGPGWKKLCLALGGTAEVTHGMPKIFSKGRTFEYVTTTGYTVRISEHMHNKVQRGAAYRYSVVEGDINSKCSYSVV